MDAPHALNTNLTDETTYLARKAQLAFLGASLGVFSLLGGIRKMFGEEKRFHSDQIQLLNSTSGKPSWMMTSVYNPQRFDVPIRGTELVNCTRRPGTPSAIAPFAELLLISVFLLSLFLTGCSPSMHQSNLGPPEMPPMVIISGSSTVSGDLVVDSLVNDRHIPTYAAGASYQDRLVEFSHDPAVKDRLSRVTGWLEFSRSKVVLSRLNQGMIRIASARNSLSKLAHSEAELHEIFDKNKEWTLWSELLVDPEFDTMLTAEDLSVVKLRLQRVAQVLAMAERPEDVQEIDQLFLKD
ncbi:MAG: hypothetical protein J0L82_12805 [Deltaproteobacteria bacterium]|nr:hypothetical protein [Deltaproteobacteria bacterium]